MCAASSRRPSKTPGGSTAGRGTANFEWLGGCLCLDFVNTVSWGVDGSSEERLGSQEDLLAWAAAAGIGLSGMHGPIEAGKAATTLGTARELRAALHGVFLAEAEEQPAPEAAAATLAGFAEQAASHLLLSGPHAAARAPWRFAFAGAEQGEDVLWTVAWDAARLLTSVDRPPVRRCANDRCRWLFLDTSRRGNRRWCDMGVCGSRAKARAYYRRRKEKDAGDAPSR